MKIKKIIKKRIKKLWRDIRGVEEVSIDFGPSAEYKRLAQALRGIRGKGCKIKAQK